MCAQNCREIRYVLISTAKFAEFWYLRNFDVRGNYTFYTIHPASTYPLELYVPDNVTWHADHRRRFTRASVQWTSTNRNFCSARLRPNGRLKSSNLGRDVTERLAGTGSVLLINDHLNGPTRLRLAPRIRSGQTDDSTRNETHSTSDDCRKLPKVLYWVPHSTR